MAFRIIFRILISIIFIIPLFLISANCFGQTTDCIYDKDAPSLDHARILFKSLKYPCAEKEINDFIRMNKANLKGKADAYVLLAAVYYAMLQDDREKRGKVVEQFKQAFRSFKEWQGELDIKSNKFKEMMEDAKKEVEREPKTDVIKPVEGPECPSSTTAWIFTAAFAGSTTFFMISNGSAVDKWDEYTNSWNDDSIYDSYSKAVNLRKVAGILTIGTGIFATYQWLKYFKAKRNCDKSNQGIISNAGLNINVSPGSVFLTFNF